MQGMYRSASVKGLHQSTNSENLDQQEPPLKSSILQQNENSELEKTSQN
jgi:hypothetical protein